MKKLRILSLILALIFVISSIPFVVFAEDAATTSDIVFDIPVCDNVASLSGYTYANKGTTEMLSAEQAAAEGVPTGYSGNVLKITQTVASADGISFYLDLNETICKGISLSDIKSITFKYWVPTGSVVSSIRIKTKGVSSWQYNKAPAKQGEWVSLTMDNSIFVADENGEISPFAFAFRTASNVTPTLYFDGVSVEFKEGAVPPAETEAPTETETETEAPEAPDPLYYSFADGKGKDEIPYGAKSSDGTWYDYKNFKMMDEAQAKYAKVPEGYSGWVLALDPGSANGTSIGLDLTSIRTNRIIKITFRVWCPTGTKQHDTDGGIRLSGAATNTWSAKISPSAIGEWIDVSLEKDDYSFLDFDGDGYCDPINFCFRGATETAYIDAITVELIPADTAPPVITYEGETVINTSAEKPFVIDISAYDAYDDQNVTPEFVWSDGALDEEGKLVMGNHTCTVKATDFYGNVSEIVLTVNVGERDTEAPVLNWCPDIDGIYAMEGTIPSFNVTATDNYDKVEAVLTWSKGALNETGKLNKGLHTLTVSATDLTGNTTEYTVYVCVISERPVVGDVILDSN